MPRRFQFSLKWPFVALAGTMAGGQTARALLLAETPSLGGVPVSWSAWGEATFFCIGCVAALGGMAAAALAPAVLRVRSPWRGCNSTRQMAALLGFAFLVGAASAGAAFLVLLFTFFAIPQEVFDFLTTKA